MEDIGSVWQRWDLHLHAPGTAMNDGFAGGDDDAKWDAYVTTLESLGNYGALGITDYFGLDGYLRCLSYKNAGRLANVGVLLPNIELRITPVTASEKAINLHVIACPSIAAELQSIFLGQLRFEFNGEPYSATHEGLVRLGRAYTGNHTLPEVAAYRAGVKQFKVEYSQIVDAFRNSARLRQKALIAVAQGSNDGNSGIQDSGLQAMRTEIYRMSHLVLSGNPKDREYFLGKGVDSVDTLRIKIGGPKPCVHGSDAHSLDELGKPDQERHTWIKAEPSFEGLRQILFEPETRVRIGSSAPPTPIHRLRNLSINLPSDTKLWAEGVDQDFCLRGDSTLTFAPGLTCVIGGRGAGKSSVLNLIEEKLTPGRNEFWKRYQLRDSSNAAVSISSVVALQSTGDRATVEFISQNEVEALALEPERLTEAMLTRLLSLDASGELVAALSELEQEQNRATHRESVIREYQRLSDDIAEAKQGIDGAAQLLRCYTDPEYLQPTAALEDVSRRRTQLATDRSALAGATTALESALEGITPSEDTDADQSAYRQRLLALRASVLAAVAIARGSEDLDTPGADEVELESTASKHKQAIRNFLVSQGLSSENLSDLTLASEQKAKLEKELARLQLERERLQEFLAVGLQLERKRESVEVAINKILSSVNQQFSSGAAEARRVEVRYVFDSAAAADAAIDWLVAQLAKAFPSDRQYRVDHVRNCLERAGEILVVTDEDLMAAVREDTSKTGQTLDAFFSREPNQSLWSNTRLRLRNDAHEFMRLEIAYDGKPLRRTSFGQRCSAVLVVLLSLGNRPIVVDEPEAHLDSAIIADFMVDLVKKVKVNRQVIFATHNANFVINGDAELVHVLTPDSHGRTQLTSTTIENLATRHLLLALEGGERAFLQREGRYGIGA